MLSKGDFILLNYDRMNLIYYYLAGFIGACFIASMFAAAPAKSFFKMVPFLIGAILFYKMTTRSWELSRLRKLLNYLIAGIFILSLIGNVQYILLLIKGATGLSLRVVSLTTHPNALAKFVLPFIPVAVTLAVTSEEAREKLIYSLVTISLVAVEMFTISRGAWIGMAFSMLLLAILFRSYKILVTIFVLGGMAVLLLPAHIGLERIYSIFSLTHQWNIERINVWNASIQMIKDHPLVGLGLNNFQYYYLAYKPAHGVEIFQHAHNTFLNVAVEIGIPGMICLALFTFTVLYQICCKSTPSINKQYLSKSIGIGILGLLVFGMVEYNFNNEAQIVLFFLLLAIGITMRNIGCNSNNNTRKARFSSYCGRS